ATLRTVMCRTAPKSASARRPERSRGRRHGGRHAAQRGRGVVHRGRGARPELPQQPEARRDPHELLKRPSGGGGARAMKRGSFGQRAWLACWCGATLLTGCNVPIAAGLDESDANHAVVALEKSGVAAEKDRDPESEG